MEGEPGQARGASGAWTGQGRAGQTPRHRVSELCPPGPEGSQSARAFRPPSSWSLVTAATGSWCGPRPPAGAARGGGGGGGWRAHSGAQGPGLRNRPQSRCRPSLPLGPGVPLHGAVGGPASPARCGRGSCVLPRTPTQRSGRSSRDPCRSKAPAKWEPKGELPFMKFSRCVYRKNAGVGEDRVGIFWWEF